MSSLFGWIAPAVGRDARVCAYDRAGYGWSPPADAPQDGAEIATDLHELLHRAEIAGPYVLAGHSFGGLYVQSFAARHPDETAGMVLIDSTAPAPSPSAGAEAAEGPDSTSDRLSALASIVGRVGIGRALAQLDFETLPPASRDEARADAGTPTRIRTMIDEYGQAGSSAREAAELDDLGDTPLIVVTAGSGSSPGWPEKQAAMAALSTNSLHRVIDGATHETLILDEEDAAETSRAIRDVVAAVRTGSLPER